MLHSPFFLPILQNVKLLQIIFKLLVLTQGGRWSSKHRRGEGMYLLLLVCTRNESRTPLQIAKITGNRESPKSRVLHLIPPASSQAYLCMHTLCLILSCRF